MARQNRTNRIYHKNKPSRVEHFKLMRRCFWHCIHWNSPAYNAFPSPVDTMMVRAYLKPNKVEMEYDKARIELEGPESKKWPGADWVEETTADLRARKASRRFG